MSIEGMSNYEYARYENVRPEWQKIERYDYCEQDIHPAGRHGFGRLISFFRKMIGE